MADAIKPTIEAVQAHATRFITDVKATVENVKQRKLDASDVRILNVLVLGIYSVLALLLPSIVRFLLSGFAFTPSSCDSTASTADFVIRISGSFAITVFLLINMSSRWEDKGAKGDLQRATGACYIVAALVLVLKIASGGSLLLILPVLVTGALAYACLYIQ